MASTIWTLAKKHLEPLIESDVAARIDAASKKNLNEFGVDPFGFDPEVLKLVSPIFSWLYEHYFRCEVTGVENILPGKMIVIANHSGQLPFDAMMIATAFLREPKVPRLLRGMAERWTADLPYISTLFARSGAVVGEPKICEALLKNDEAVIVFPEGVNGITKLFQERYQLKKFGSGFMRLALKTGAPIVPVAVVGAEEQAPAIANLSTLANILRFPAFPLIFPQVIPLPMPVKYHILIGKPIYVNGDGTEEGRVVQDLVNEAKKRIAELLALGLKKRKNIFF